MVRLRSAFLALVLFVFVAHSAAAQTPNIIDCSGDSPSPLCSGHVLDTAAAEELLRATQVAQVEPLAFGGGGYLIAGFNASWNSEIIGWNRTGLPVALQFATQSCPGIPPFFMLPDGSIDIPNLSAFLCPGKTFYALEIPVGITAKSLLTFHVGEFRLTYEVPPVTALNPNHQISFIEAVKNHDPQTITANADGSFTVNGVKYGTIGAAASAAVLAETQTCIALFTDEYVEVSVDVINQFGIRFSNAERLVFDRDHPQRCLATVLAPIATLELRQMIGDKPSPFFVSNANSLGYNARVIVGK